MLNRPLNFSRKMFGAMLCSCVGLVTNAATASTAVFTEPATLSPTEIASLSAAGDSAGVSLALGEILALLFDTPFGISKTDSVSIFTLPPSTGSARLTVSFGRFNGGAPIFVETKSVNAGNALTVTNLFQQGCSAFGGCDYIEIATSRTQRGSTGAEVDYVDVNGEVITVAAPTPEPATWAMMIVGFALVAIRLKALRLNNVQRANSIGALHFRRFPANRVRLQSAATGMQRIPTI